MSLNDCIGKTLKPWPILVDHYNLPSVVGSDSPTDTHWPKDFLYGVIRLPRFARSNHVDPELRRYYLSLVFAK